MTSPRTLRLGTRGSRLALAQSGAVADRLAAVSGFTVELVPIRTEGDVLTGPLATVGGSGVFVTAVRQAVLDGRCDLAVHSLKDLPTGAAPGITLAAVPERADPRDALCAVDGAALLQLPAGARVGTGSPRRAAMLRAARPDLQVMELRGNVDTRLARVGSDDLDAVVLARAGLARIGRLDAITETLDPQVMTPAPGQGALAVECRADSASTADKTLVRALATIDDPASRAAVTAERALLAALEAGCSAPVGALAVVDDTGRLRLDARVCRPDGGAVLQEFATTAWETDLPDYAVAERLGRDLADLLLADGAASLAGLPGPVPSTRPTEPR